METLKKERRGDNRREKENVRMRGVEWRLRMKGLEQLRVRLKMI